MFRQYNLTLDGTAQSLADAIVPAPLTVEENLRDIILQPDDGASNPFFFGDENVTLAVYAFRLEGGATPPLPFSVGHFSTGPLKLGDLWVIGTADEILNIGVIPY